MKPVALHLAQSHRRRPVAVALDFCDGYWLIQDENGMVKAVHDDMLTAVYIYRFGTNGDRRLAVARPSRRGLELLRAGDSRAVALLREFPPRSYFAEFELSPDAEEAYRCLLAEH